MNRFRIQILAIVLVSLGLNFGGITSYASDITATSMISKINVNEHQTSLKTYNIGGHNFVKLRDIAWLLNKSDKQFNVVWDDEHKSINILSKTPYTMSKPEEESFNDNAKGSISTAPIYKDGQKIQMNAYVIGNRTYFKLQDICKTLDIQLDWDEQNKLVLINSSASAEFKSGYYDDPIANVNADSYKSDVISLINVKRANAGLDKLSQCNNLDKVAQFRAEDMFKDNYFSHNSPTYGNFGDVADSFGYRESCMGENIAKGQSTPSEVVKDWINSSGHKANILSDKYEDIGIGIIEYEPGRFIWVQVFSGTYR